MSLVIKPANMKYKDSQGNYKGVNTVGETTTAEQIAAVNDAGANQVAAVQAESATQQAAIQQKGEDVLDSIPSDYTELSEDVDDLKSAVEYRSDFARWYDGYLVRSDTGRDSANSSFSATASVPCTPGERITIHTSITGLAGICQYDESKTFLQNKSITVNDAISTDLYQFVAEGYYIRISCLLANKSDFWIVFDDRERINQISTNISAIETRLSQQILIQNQTYAESAESIIIELPGYNTFTETPVISCDAMFTRNVGVTDYPRIQLRMNNNRNLERNTTWYAVGREGEYEIKEWRFPAYNIWENKTAKIAIKVPTGCTLTIRKMWYRFDSSTDKTQARGVEFFARPGTCNFVQELTIPAMQMAVRHGYGAFTVIPKISSDGVWFAYHDDTWNIDTTYLRNPNGTKITNTEYNGDYFSDIPFSYLSQYRYTVYGSMFSDSSLLKLEDCFEFLAKTGMKLRLSMHPQYGINTTANLTSLKRLIQKYGLLDDLTIIVNNIDSLFPVFGNDIGGYCFPNVVGANWTGTANRVDAGVTAAIAAKTTYNITTNISCGLWSDSLFADRSKAEELVSDILSEGFKAGVFSYNYVGIDGASHAYLWGEDMHWLMSIGVTEFTDGYNTSIGLNW